MKKSKTKSALTRNFLISLGIPGVFIPGLILASILGWDWKSDIFKLTEPGSYRQSKEIFPVTAKVINILDGDTFEITSGQTIRMIGIDAPNRGEPDFEQAKEYLEDIIAGETVSLEYDYYQDDKFGRILAYVWENCTSQLGCKDGRRLVNSLMIKKRLAKFVSYEDRRPIKYKDLLIESEN